MRFIADLHVHSKFSRATAKNLDLENLYMAARLKGITVVGTGDFTHPGWLAEIKEKLVPAEDGLFRLKDDVADICDREIPASCNGEVRFILETEISNIYKKNDKTRKNHNLVFLPDIDSAEQFNARLDAIGNINSDGRPILGLDARDLLEILLETSDQGFLVPAHIWTPWFSLLGSKSGFNSLEECFEDLSEHIFAVETGLSSDPEMNWRISGLDNLTLISNSDAHSPLKLGREANLFNTDLSYREIKSALKTGDPEKFLGTYEFYPEEGKYHLDGHRKCETRLWPKKSHELNGICPVCEKPLTLGVLYRVEELADKDEGRKPEKNHPFYSVIPLEEVLSEILKVGPKSKKVQNAYRSVINQLGPEFDILYNIPAETIDQAGLPLLGMALDRMRTKKINISPGYDGEFGRIKIFKDQERDELLGQKSLFVMPEEKTTKKKRSKKKPHKKPSLKTVKKKALLPKNLNARQQAAVERTGSPLLIVAGPGTGKTLTLTHKIAYLIKEQKMSHKNILAITFTNKAALEMKSRLERLLKNPGMVPYTGTFHSFCLKILRECESNKDKNGQNLTIIDDNDRKLILADALGQINHKDNAKNKTSTLMDAIISAKQQILGPDDPLDQIAEEYGLNPTLLSSVYAGYQDLLALQGLYDFEDLIFNAVKLLETDSNIRKHYQEMYPHIFVDEYQDLNQGQYRIVRALSPRKSGLCVIGDPEQSIYGFRGSDTLYFRRFVDDYPEADVIHLNRNYRSVEAILDASYSIIREQSVNITGDRVYSNIAGEKQISILELETEKAEAVAVGKTIENMVGGLGFYSIDFGKADDASRHGELGFSDFAVLFRTSAQSKPFEDAFSKAGIPFQIASRKNAFYQKGIIELISLLKILAEDGSYADMERIIKTKGTNVSKTIFNTFKSWGIQNRFSLNKALTQVKRFPVPDLTGKNQLKLDEFVSNVVELKEKGKGMTVPEKLVFLREQNRSIDNTIITSKAEDAFDALIILAGQHKEETTGFLESITLQTDQDTCDLKAERVPLMTMHAAKGLEFPIVFIVGCENGYIPMIREEKGGRPQISNIDEERRLFYVAMTRAKERIFLTYSKKRMIYGKKEKREISPFVKDIEEELIRLEKKGPLKKKEKEGHVQMNLF